MVCGVYCGDCRFFGTACDGCGVVEGKPFWVKQYHRDICNLYGCCQTKGYKHCGLCAEYPCRLFLETSDPSFTAEEASQKLIDRQTQLAIRKAVGTAAWLKLKAGDSAKEHSNDRP